MAIKHPRAMAFFFLSSTGSVAYCWAMNCSYSPVEAKPITRSTPARLYQERSNSTISPAVGRCWT